MACGAVRHALKLRGYEQIASDSGLDIQVITEIVERRRPPTNEQYKALATALGLNRNQTDKHRQEAEHRMKLGIPASCDQPEDGHSKSQLAIVSPESSFSFSSSTLLAASGNIGGSSGRGNRGGRGSGRGGIIAHNYNYIHGTLPESESTQKGLSGCHMWDELQLVYVEKYTEDTSRFDFAFTDRREISYPLVSSTCSIRAVPYDSLLEDEPWHDVNPLGWPGKYPVYRSFCPVTKRGAEARDARVAKGLPARGILSLLVKKDETTRAGLMSVHIHNLARPVFDTSGKLRTPGAKLGILGYNQMDPDVTASYWKFKIEELNDKVVIMLAVGWGIAPLFQILDYIFDQPEPENEQPIYLVFENRTEEDIIMKPELDRFRSDHHGRFNVLYLVSNPPSDWEEHDNIKKGGIDQEFLEGYIPFPKTVENRNVQIYVAGPDEKVTEIAGKKGGSHFSAFSDQGDLGGILAETTGGILVKLANDRRAKAVVELAKVQLQSDSLQATVETINTKLNSEGFKKEVEKVLLKNYTQVHKF